MKQRFFFIAFLFLCSNSAWALPFAKLLPHHNGSCRLACNEINHDPVSSDTYAPTGHPFYFCAANHDGQGERGGYNLEFTHSSCIIGFAGGELVANDARCLCSHPGQVQWFDAAPADGGNCKNTCKNNGRVAIKTGNIKGGGGATYACSANVNGEGFRGGSNLEGTGNCTAGWGGQQVTSTSFRCGCN